MPETIVDVSIVVLTLGMTYALTSEGLWGAALMFFNVLIAGLIAFNFYEPLAALLAENVEALSGFADTLCLTSLFIVSLFLLRLTTESIAPSMVRFPMPIYNLGRLAFGLAGGAVTMAMLILIFHTAPVHKKIFGSMDYKSAPPFGMGFDRSWLAFFQYTTAYVFADYSGEQQDPWNEFGTAKAFDVRGSWLIDHQNARPYGEPNVPEPEGSGEGGEPGQPSAPAGGAPPGAPGGAPPGAAAGPQGDGPGIPGGTAGAAAGLAPTNP